MENGGGDAAGLLWNRENEVSLRVGEQYIAHEILGKDE